MREQASFDPYLEANLYLGAMAGSHGGEGTRSAADALTGKESVRDILLVAIELEGKSILFYAGLRDMVPANLGKDRIDRIIAEEKQHVVTLTDELRKSAGPK
jgi:rubrerythrin